MRSPRVDRRRAPPAHCLFHAVLENVRDAESRAGVGEQRAQSTPDVAQTRQHHVGAPQIVATDPPRRGPDPCEYPQSRRRPEISRPRSADLSRNRHEARRLRDHPQIIGFRPDVGPREEPPAHRVDVLAEPAVGRRSIRARSPVEDRLATASGDPVDRALQRHVRRQAKSVPQCLPGRPVAPTPDPPERRAQPRAVDRDEAHETDLLVLQDLDLLELPS